MSGTLILLQLAGYVGLLLWGTHMVSTGVERGFGAELRLWLGHRLSQPGRGARLRAVMIGLAVTAVLQSSTATGLMTTSFAARGAIDLGPALAVMLGANVGSTLITQVLAFDIAAVAPLLVLIGVVVFRSSGDGRAKNLGRVAIGLRLMLLALGALVPHPDTGRDSPRVARPARVSGGRAGTGDAGRRSTHLGVPLERRGRPADCLARRFGRGRARGVTGARPGR